MDANLIMALARVLGTFCAASPAISGEKFVLFTPILRDIPE
jgi:hypothetical protein